MHKMAARHFAFIGTLLSVLVSAVKPELCYYYDYILNEDDFNICYSGCCDDVCCDDYWSSGKIAGAAVGSIIGTIILMAILVAVVRVCCATNTRGRVVYRTAATPGVTVISQSNTCHDNQIATPYMAYPQHQQQPVTQLQSPPPYAASSTTGIDNPNFVKY